MGVHIVSTTVTVMIGTVVTMNRDTIDREHDIFKVGKYARLLFLQVS